MRNGRRIVTNLQRGNRELWQWLWSGRFCFCCCWTRIEGHANETTERTQTTSSWTLILIREPKGRKKNSILICKFGIGSTFSLQTWFWARRLWSLFLRARAYLLLSKTIIIISDFQNKNTKRLFESYSYMIIKGVVNFLFRRQERYVSWGFVFIGRIKDKYCYKN